MVLPQYKNNATTRLDGIHLTGSSTLTVIDASVFPTLGVGETFFVTLWNSILYSRTKDDADMEVVEVNDVTGNVLTLVSPTTNDHISGAGVDNMLTEDFFRALETDIVAIEADIATNAGNISSNDTDIATNASNLATHIGDTANPHVVTKTQVGLNNVTNDEQLRADQLEIATTTNDDTKVPSLGLLYNEKVALQAEIDSDVAAATLALQSEIDSDIATHTAIADAHHTNANDPTSDQKAALTGSHGTPSASNKYLTEDGLGVASGIAELDSGGKVPIAQLPDSVVGAVEYQGTWDANTNTPTLTTTPSEKGLYYKVSVAGTFDSIYYEVGDWIISNGTSWEKVDNTDQVTSVFGRQGAVVAQSGDYDASQITNFQTTVSANTDVAASKTKTDFISITQAVDLDTMESDVAASKTKTDFISITQAVDLDAIESKLDGIESGADVTDATNVAAAGALMKSGGTMTGALSMGNNSIGNVSQIAMRGQINLNSTGSISNAKYLGIHNGTTQIFLRLDSYAGRAHYLYLPGATGSAGQFLVTNGGDVNSHVTASWSDSFPFVDVPASASASGTVGQMAKDSNYLYICIATDTWKRAPLSTW